MRMQNLHIRMSIIEYHFVCALAKELNCSKAEVIRRALFDTDMKGIVQEYYKRREKEDFEDILSCRMNEDSKKVIEGCISSLNENTAILRKISTDAGELLRQITKGNFYNNAWDRNRIANELHTLVENHEKAVKKQGILAEKLAGFLDGIKLEIW